MASAHRAGLGWLRGKNSTRQTRKVLLAEDDLIISSYLVILLRQLNCEVVEGNSRDAIRWVGTFQPDIALIGFVMPGMDGSKVGIKLLKVSSRTRVVLIAAVPIRGVALIAFLPLDTCRENAGLARQDGKEF
jgi:CheY-like chemotaxis protein